jgi:hypothetical protein
MKYLCLLLLLGCGAGPVFSSVIIEQTLPAPCSNYKTMAQLIEAGSCGLGYFTLKHFDFGPSPTHPESPLTAEDISVSFGITPGSLSLFFSSTGFVVTGDDAAGYILRYLIDPPPVIIRGFEEEMETFTPVAPGIASINTSLCVGGRLVGEDGCENLLGLNVFHDGTENSQTQASVGFSPTNILDVVHEISLEANGASADFRGLSNGVVVSDIPEPATLVLIGAGLAALSLFRRRPR